MELQDFKARVLPLKDRLYRIALYMLKSVVEAEDTLQDVMLKLWDKRSRLHEYTSLEAFAVTMTKNACLDKLKSKKHKYQIDIQDFDFDSKSISAQSKIEQQESYSVMLSAFARLPEQQRLLVTLRDVEGYEYEEIALMTGLQVNNIRVGLSRARKAARTHYLKMMDHEEY